MVSNSERTKILEMIEEGTISAEEGLTLLQALGTSPDIGDETQVSHHPQEEAVEQAISIGTKNEYANETVETFDGDVEVLPPVLEPPDTDEINKWKRWWTIPLWGGVAITVIGGLLMFWALNANGFGFWFACAWFPFLFGVALLALAWSSRTSPWLHVRVHQSAGKTPSKIAISFPIPVRLTTWGLRTFGHFIPHMENISLDEVIMALKEVSKEGTPLSVDVDEGEDGERVQVFIG